jgi:hypothetical protein
VAVGGKRRRRHAADVPQTKNRHPHWLSRPRSGIRARRRAVIQMLFRPPRSPAGPLP